MDSENNLLQEIGSITGFTRDQNSSAYFGIPDKSQADINSKSALDPSQHTVPYMPKFSENIKELPDLERRLIDGQRGFAFFLPSIATRTNEEYSKTVYNYDGRRRIGTT